MNIKQSRESLVFDYRTLRLIIGVLAFAFPTMVYALTGKITTSISASYHEDATRDVFVGFLFILGALLISYKGHRLPVSSGAGGKLWVRIQRDQEDWISAIGGIASILTALYPTACDDCSVDTKARIHTIGAFILFFNVFYFSLIAFLRSLNIKLQGYDELREIKKVKASEPRSLFRRFSDTLFAEILLFRRLVAEVSRRYDEGYSGKNAKLSSSYRRERLKFLRDAYGQKIRRGGVYVVCGVLITVVFAVYLFITLLLPDLVTPWKLTFLVETISLVLFGTAWTTASHLPIKRKIKLWLALRQRKQALVAEPGTT